MGGGSPTTEGLGAFNDLATEIVIAIFSFVDWRDLLSIRKTCKYFCEVSKTKLLWENYVRRYSSPTPNSPGFLRMYLPLSMYTASELEHAVQRWEMSESSWRQGLLYKCQLATGLPPHKAVHLITGGRYLLRLLHDGSLVYHDLDKKHKGHTVLIPSQDASLNRTYIDFAVDEVHSSGATFTSSSRLLARIAIIYSTGAGFHTFQYVMDVWSLNLTAAASQSQVKLGLVAEHISTVQFPADLLVSSMVLFNNQIAFTCVSKATKQVYMAASNWSTERRKVKFGLPVRYISLVARPYNIKKYFLEDKLLLTVNLSGHRMALWSIHICKESTEPPPLSFSRSDAMVWEYISSHKLDEVSGPFKCSGSTRFIISGRSKIQGLIIYPCLPVGTTEVVDLMSIPHGIRFAAQSCYHRTVYRPGSAPDIGEATAVTLRWPDEDGHSSLAPIPAEQLFYPRFLSDNPTGRSSKEFTILMDDASGRIVTVAPGVGVMEMWETAPSR